MTSVPPWSPSYDFSGDPAPQNLINAAALQSQLTLLAQYLANLSLALGATIRDDDTLEDQIVRLRNLHPETIAHLDSFLLGTVATEALAYKYPVRGASTGNIASLTDAQTIDGVALTSGDRFLAKDQTLPSQNGIWIIHAVGDPAPNAAGLWTRATDLPAGQPSGAGWVTLVREGTINGETAWMPLTGGAASDQPVVGADDLPFMSLLAPLPVPISRGGTGATDAPAARMALGAAGKEAAEITGDGATTAFVIPHAFGTALFLVAVQDQATGEEVAATYLKTVSNLTVTFAVPPNSTTVFDVTMIG